MAATVFLVRHAAHDRVDHVLCGRMLGVTLGETGREQARRLAERFARERVGAVVTSPLERARETAGPIAERLRLKPHLSDAMNEIDFGDWTGRRFDDLDGDPRWASWNEERGTHTPPGGEPMTAAQARAFGEVRRLADAHEGGGVVIVSHCDVIKAVVARVLGLPLEAYRLFDISPASVTVLALWSGGGKVVSLNEALPA